jgi:hypothetical protein
MSAGPRRIGFPRCDLPPFPSARSLFQAGRPPNFSVRVQSLVRPVLFGVCSPSSPRRISGGAVLPWGFVPIRDITGRVHIRGVSQFPAPFRPQVFATSRRFSPRSASRASFIPQPRPGFPFRGLIPTRSRLRLVAGPCLPALVAPALTGCPAATRSRVDFEAFFRGSMRTSNPVVNLLRRRSPLRVLLLQVFCPLRPVRLSTPGLRS